VPFKAGLTVYMYVYIYNADLLVSSFPG